MGDVLQFNNKVCIKSVCRHEVLNNIDKLYFECEDCGKVVDIPELDFNYPYAKIYLTMDE